MKYKAATINKIYDVNIRTQTVYTHQKKIMPSILNIREEELEEELEKAEIKTNGRYGYNEEYIKINKEQYVRLTIVDVQTRVYNQ